MVRTLLVALLVCCGTASARPQPSPFFKGAALPTPPRQDAPWPHGSDKLSDAAATLFAQGLSDPRGLEYRVIEIVVGGAWGTGGQMRQTHGWLLPGEGTDGRFAIAWNGLVYPVTSVGELADLRKDCAATLKTAAAPQWNFGETSELYSVSYAAPSPLKMVLLARLGELKPSGQTAKGAVPRQPADLYLPLANEWAWFAFERAVWAHQRGDDRLALADARLLTRIRPLIEAEAKRRGYKPELDYTSTSVPERKLPYVQFLSQLPELLADCERRVAGQEKPPPRPDNIAALIDDLENVNVLQSGQPGGVALAADARVLALIRLGDKAVEPLLDAVEKDERLTRSVSFHRDFFRSRRLHSVSEAAYAGLVGLLRVQFKSYDEKGQPLTKAAAAAQMRAYWAKMRALPPMERFYALLKDDKAGKDQWLQAASYIVQPVDIEDYGGWVRIPNRPPGEKILRRGEMLRDGRKPSVSELLARRSDSIAAMRTGHSMESFLFLDACNMALHLDNWDKPAALPVLKRRLTRVWNIGKRKDDAMNMNDSIAGHLGMSTAALTLARARAGDMTGYDEYAAWIEKINLREISYAQEEMVKPLIQGMARPRVGKAIDYLFNNPKSVWANVLAPSNSRLLTNFWQTPLCKTAGFRKQADRALSNKAQAGSITFNPRKDWDSSTEAGIVLAGAWMGFRGSNGDPDTPPAGQKRSFRVCDAYAYFYAQYQHGPKFQLFWPEKKRDAGVLACRKWLASK